MDPKADEGSRSEPVVLACLMVMVRAVRKAAEFAESAATAISRGDEPTAYKEALEVEPLLHEADVALQAAAMMRRAIAD